MTPDRDHYSYTVYADPTTARTFDERRFGGPIGTLVASQQAMVLLQSLGPVKDRAILDVGTGTGRAAFLMAGAGARVTGVDASEEMLSVARARANHEVGSVCFAAGDAHDLAFPNRSFDIAVSLRVLMHTPRWTRSVDELCRVARHLVVLDYPSRWSAAWFQSMTRRCLHAAGVETEPYRVFADGAVTAAIERNGFRVRSRHRQFVLPIALHKAIGSPAFTTRSERLLERIGLLGLFGSPVTIVAERCERS